MSCKDFVDLFVLDDHDAVLAPLECRGRTYVRRPPLRLCECQFAPRDPRAANKKSR